MFLYRLGRGLCRYYVVMAHGYQVFGREHVPESGPLILAANHISYLDPPLLGASINRPVYFMAKAELFKIPILGPYLRAIDTFPVHRGAADRGAIRHALAVLERGDVFGLFPEGTRSRTGQLLEPQKGVSLIALRSHAPVIPVGITGTSSIDRKLYPVKRPQLCIQFGPPVNLDDLRAERGGKQVLAEASSRVMDAIAEQIARARANRNE